MYGSSKSSPNKTNSFIANSGMRILDTWAWGTRSAVYAYVVNPFIHVLLIDYRLIHSLIYAFIYNVYIYIYMRSFGWLCWVFPTPVNKTQQSRPLLVCLAGARSRLRAAVTCLATYVKICINKLYIYI